MKFINFKYNIKVHCIRDKKKINYLINRIKIKEKIS